MHTFPKNRENWFLILHPSLIFTNLGWKVVLENLSTSPKLVVCQAKHVLGLMETEM